MGCLCSNSNSDVQKPLGSKELPNLINLSSVDSNKISKTFSEQVDKIKNFDMVYENFLNSAKKASTDFQQSLQGLDFYFSKKEFDDSEKVPEELQCPACFVTYNVEEYKPLELPCGHILCLNCCKSQFESTLIIKCGYDCAGIQEDPETFTIYQEALHKVQWINNGQYCFLHNSESSHFCSNCRKLICETCQSDHIRHTITPLSAPSISKELSTSKSNLDSYISSLESTLKDLSSIQSTFKDLQIKLLASLANTIKKIKSSESILLNNIETSSSHHIETLKTCIGQILETMPIRDLNLYHDSLLSEQEKAKTAEQEINNEKTRILHLTQVDFKNANKLNDPDFKPWEKVLSQVSSIDNIEFLLLALISLTINSVN